MNRERSGIAIVACGLALLFAGGLTTGCGGGGGGGGDDLGGEVLAAMEGTELQSAVAVDPTPPDPETQAVLNEVASATLRLIVASTTLAEEADDQAPDDPIDLAEAIVDDAPAVRLVDEVRDRIKIFSLAAGGGPVHDSVIDIPLFEWVYEHDKDQWRVEYDDSVFNNAIIRARLIDENGEPTKHYGSTTTDVIEVDFELDWFPSLSMFEADGAFTFDGFQSENDQIVIDGKMDIEIWSAFDGEVRVDGVTIDSDDLWDLRYPIDGEIYMDLMGFAEITAVLDDDEVELEFQVFDSVTVGFTVNNDWLFPTDFEIDL